MQRFFRSWLGLVVLVPIACGAPAELDESRFPPLNEVGYTDGNFGPNGARGGASGVANGGAPNVGAPSGGAPNVARAGSGGSGNLARGGTGSVSTAGTSASMGGNLAAGGTGVTGSSGAGGVQPPPAGNCPDDITVLFARPGSAGGCTQSGGCHEAGSPIKPDLVSPNIEVRLVDVASSCKGRPYIGADDSFLADKIVGSPPECNGAMPFLSPQTLNAADEQCILDWIDEVSGG